MQVIDSNKQQLETHEVITMAIDEQRGEYSLQEDLLNFTNEASMPSAVLVSAHALPQNYK